MASTCSDGISWKSGCLLKGCCFSVEHGILFGHNKKLEALQPFPRLLRLCRNVCQLKVQPTAPEKRKTSTKNLRTLKLGGQNSKPQTLEMIHTEEKGKEKTSKNNLHSLKLQEQSSNFSLQWNSSKNHQEDFSQEV